MMDKELDMVEMKSTEHELQVLVGESNKAELAQCVRMLSMYIALYKKTFGELPQSCFEKILASDIMDKETAKVFEKGMLEAITILSMVMQAQSPSQKDNHKYAGITIN